MKALTSESQIWEKKSGVSCMQNCQSASGCIGYKKKLLLRHHWFTHQNEQDESNADNNSYHDFRIVQESARRSWTWGWWRWGGSSRVTLASGRERTLWNNIPLGINSSCRPGATLISFQVRYRFCKHNRDQSKDQEIISRAIFPRMTDVPRQWCYGVEEGIEKRLVCWRLAEIALVSLELRIRIGMRLKKLKRSFLGPENLTNCLIYRT